MINDNLHEIGYDSKKMPLGKLSPITLTNGLNILKEIESELKSASPDRTHLSELSSKFYSQIPHDFGFQKMSTFIIDTTDKVKEKIDMISTLSDMKITLKILENYPVPLATTSVNLSGEEPITRVEDCIKQFKDKV